MTPSTVSQKYIQNPPIPLSSLFLSLSLSLSPSSLSPWLRPSISHSVKQVLNRLLVDFLLLVK